MVKPDRSTILIHFSKANLLTGLNLVKAIIVGTKTNATWADSNETSYKAKVNYRQKITFTKVSSKIAKRKVLEST
jgi:hypothetical protein